MIVKVAKFTKRKNSTKRPSTYAAEIDVQLKMNTSTENPVLLFNDEQWNNSYDYVYIPSWDSYYFKTDAVIRTGQIWEVSLTMDTLATYKEDIGNYTAFVERAASSYDSMIDDVAVSSKEEFTKVETNTSGLGFSISGTYLLRTVGGYNAGSDTGISTYYMNQTQLKNVLDFMFDAGNYGDTLADETIKTFFNPFQYIVDLRWIPCSITDLMPDSTPVYFGWWMSANNVNMLHAHSQQGGGAISVPSSSYSDYRKYSDRFSTVQLYLPGVGVIKIDNYTAHNNPYVMWQLDLASGICTYFLYRNWNQSNEKLIATYTTLMAAPISIAQMGSMMGGAINAVAGVVGNLSYGNILGAVSSGISGVQSMLSPTPSINGTNGSRALMTDARFNQAKVTLYEKGSGELTTDVNGRPLCKNVQIKTLSGYVQCAGASVPLSAVDSERDTVNNYLNSGFYYE